MDLVLAALPNSMINVADAMSLAPHTWVTDNVLAFWLEHLFYVRYPQLSQVEGRVHVALNAGVATLCQVLSGGDLVESLSRTGLGPGCHSFILPLCDTRAFTTPLSGSHWTLLHWRRSAGFAHHDSSLPPEGAGGGSLKTAEVVAAALAPLLGVLPALASVTSTPCPQQTNGFDCGMHAAASMEFLAAELAGEPLAAMPEASEMRTKILRAAAGPASGRRPGSQVDAFFSSLGL
jgi:hypothetical protein